MKEETTNQHPEGCTCEECQKSAPQQKKKKLPWVKIALVAGAVAVAFLYGKNYKKVNNTVKNGCKNLKNKLKSDKVELEKEIVTEVENDLRKELPDIIVEETELVVNEAPARPAPRKEFKGWNNNNREKFNNKKAV